MWFRKDIDDAEVNCYFWCTAEGELPARDPDREDASDELDSLVGIIPSFLFGRLSDSLNADICQNAFA